MKLKDDAMKELFDRRVADWSDIQGHLPFMRDLVINMTACTVIELGVRSGNSTVAFLAGLSETGGELWSVDIDPGPQFQTTVPWHFIQGNDLDPDVLNQLPAEADIVFIDTSHHYHQTIRELVAYVPRAKVVLLHDTDLERPWGCPGDDPPYPVREAILRYLSECGCERVFYEREGSYGLGVITHP